MLVRDAARALVSAFPKDPGDDAVSTQAKGWAQELFKTSERMAANADADVLWVAERDRQRGGNQLCVAPLQVFGTMRDKLLTDKTVVMTSATLKLGGDFDAVATSVGLRPSERVGSSPSSPDVAERADGVLPWRGLDVGSPFDYGKQAILYVARHLPPPGRDGLAEATLQEIAELVDAADGRTLGLFSSRRAAETAAEAVRERLPHLTTLAQGDAQLPELARQFVDDPHTCLFGTLSLWASVVRCGSRSRTASAAVSAARREENRPSVRPVGGVHQLRDLLQRGLDQSVAARRREVAGTYRIACLP